MTIQLGHGFYTFAEAARLTNLKPRRVREWFIGRGADPSRLPVLQGDYKPVDGDFAVSFYDLVDVYVAGQLRDHGLPLQTLRRVYKRMAKDLKTSHPFCRQELRTDGKEVFLRGIDEQGREDLIEVLTRQKVFPELIAPFLKRLDYDRLLALRWHIAKGVVVDPAICFGAPVVESVGIATRIVAAAYKSNERNAELVGDWYNVTAEQVLEAVRFEAGLAA